MKALRRYISSFFPKARRPFQWRETWPLLVFLVLFGSVCAWLEFAHVWMFARPTMLGLIVLSVWVWWMHFAGYAGLPKKRGTLSLLVRLVLLGVLVMALAEPRAVRSRDVMSVVFALDVSDSIYSPDDALKYVTETVQNHRPKGKQDEAGLIIFGKTPACELSPSMSFPFEAFNSQVDRGATNIEQTLSYAGALLPEDNQGRIVLISDGVQTEGSLSRILDDLKARGVAVDVLPIDYSYSNEVWMERLDLPQAVKLGESYEAGMLVKALSGGKGKLVLRENGNVIAEQEVEYKEGTNRYTVPITLRSTGYYEYTASIEVPKAQDSLPQNNSVLNYIFVEGEGKVLLVTDGSGDRRDWESLERAIREGERAVERIDGMDMPRDAASLMPYDCIVFVNVPQDQFDIQQLQAVRDSVYNLGSGFLMVGGANSFGPGGYHRTVIEEILPVSMDVSQKKVLPKGALAIILHTCEFAEGNTWGKRITKQAIKVLGAQDEVGVLAYTQNGEQWLFELTPAGEYEKLVPAINGAQIGDMPSFQNTMNLGLKGLMKSDAATRHMIIISDGDPQPPTPALIKEFIEAQVSVSMVAIFPHGGLEISKMQSVAEVTGGRYYFPDDPNQLPAIFIKESKTLKRSMLQNKHFTPEVAFPSPILKGIEGLPELKGYVITSAKGHPAMTILTAPADADDADDQDPVLSVWQHGLGKTAAFTSDFSTNWGEQWQQWGHFQPFVKQLLTDISRVKKDGHLRMSTHTSGGDAVIVVEDFHPEEGFLDINAKLAGPNQKTENIQLKQVAPRRYQATVPLWGHGRYHVVAQGLGGERKDLAFGGFIVPYSPEYLRFRSNRQTLQEVADRTGGRVLSGDPAKDEIYQRGRAPKRSSKPIFDWLLVALAILVPLDVALRRIQLDWSSIKSALGLGRRTASTATMGALMQAKQSAAAAIESRRTERPMPTSSNLPNMPFPKRPGNSPSGSSNVVKQPPPQTPPPAEGGTSTTERLLDLKRKRDKDK
ncbi:VWA domain-containing protein [Schlesneria paludicola]|uniref:VWA domain-containing protein n=1 Tax=Schlesneria paludicola TaxID=360056 RepID=UPI00029A7ECC|nr:VWA domain-containing protein [Schlesneria paludicola]